MDVETLLRYTEVSLTDNVPCIRHAAMPFSQIKDHVALQRGSLNELDVYELLHVLFDDYDDEFTVGLSHQQQEEFQARIRKDRLSRYLSELIWRCHGERIKAASKINAATSAIMQLTANNIHAACDALTAEKNFHLTLLVAQMGQADSASQQDISDQISAWRDQNVISEMSEDIRALYGILSGSTTIVQGKHHVPVEDRASTFAISERFELDWIQAFALSLWYGKQKNEDIHMVVADFQDKLNSGLESARPVASNRYEDPLWVVLKIFTSDSGSKGRTSVTADEVEKPILPQALSALSQSWDSQKTSRLHQAMAVTLPSISIDQEKADDLAMSMAFEQSARGNITAAIYALLHLGDAFKRAHQIKDLLNRHAASLPSPPPGDKNQAQSQSSGLWTALTSSLQIPPSWIYHSKALHARSCNESLAELHYLILASEFALAHECLLRRVAPHLVIDEDWETLKDVLTRFGDDAAQSVDVAVAGTGGTEWKDGGQVYADFVELMVLMDPSTFGRRGSGQDANDKRKNKVAVLSRLQGALTGLNARFKATTSGWGAGVMESNKDRERLEERVALCEMGKAVARVIELENDVGVGQKVSLINPTLVLFTPFRKACCR